VRWNIALDPGGFPRLPGGAPNCRGMITINPTTGAVTKNQEYYSLGHISKFVQPGAYRVFSDSQQTAAFTNPDGSTALIAYNPNSSAQDVSIRWNGRLLTYTLPARSAATLYWTDPRGELVQVWLTTGDQSNLLARQANATFDSPTWTLNNFGNWMNANNWTIGAPNGVDHEARFLSAITGPRTVTANVPITLGTLRFENASAYTLAGAGNLTFSVSAARGLIDVRNGAHAIDLPVSIASDTDIAIAPGSALRFGAMTTVKADAELAIVAGEVRIRSAPALESGASIDLRDNGLIVDYEGSTSPADAINSLIASARIHSSLAIGGNTGVGWIDDVPAQRVLARFTRVGDANLDSIVNLTDFNALAGGFGHSGKVWASGDFNYDGLVNLGDFNLLAGNFGLSAGLSGPSAQDWALLASIVPEPNALLACIVAASHAGRRCRKTKRYCRQMT
jgi:hypothetical protein